MLKLNLGCGKRHIPGYLNIDIVNNSAVDVIMDVSVLSEIKDNSCDVIYASHILEHFNKKEYYNCLQTWYKKLKNQGILRLAVPDFKKITLHYANSPISNIEQLIGMVVGDDTIPFETHKMIFDYQFLKIKLEEIGFVDVRKWDWRTTEHSQIDDFSQSYLPHMDKENGKLMSLNIEATK